MPPSLGDSGGVPGIAHESMEKPDVKGSFTRHRAALFSLVRCAKCRVIITAHLVDGP